MTNDRVRPSKWTAWYLGGAILVMTIWFFPYFPQLGSPNELTRLYLTRAIVDDGSFSIDGVVSRYGHITDLARADGRLYSDKAPGVSIAGLPVYIVAKALVGWNSEAISNSSLLRLMRIFLAGLPTAAIVVLLFFLLGRIELSRSRRLFLVGAYGLGTIAFPYGVLLFGHQLATLCLVGAFSLIERNNRKPAWYASLIAGCLLGCALLCEYTTLLLVIPIAVYAVWSSSTRTRNIFLGLLGCLLPLGFLAAYHTLCFSGPFSTGYAHLAHKSFAQVHDQGLWGLVTPSFSRLLVILVSPTKGLWFFSPWLILALPGLVAALLRPKYPRLRPAWIAISTASLLYLLFAMSLQLSAWGWSLGPRHLCPLIPFWVLAIGYLLRLPIGYSKWTERTLLVLVPLSVITIVLPTAVFGGFPPDFSNPLADFTLPLLSSGCLPPSIGTSLGLTPGWAGLPFWLATAGLLIMLFKSVQMPAREKILCLALAALFVGLMLTVKGPVQPAEQRSLDWVRQDILKCDSV
ncbi:MAG: hypothetical protein JRJ19_06790 [Deltaproteobacteria bacterium]|nr:hypothetical protein [Deltaproteobacteria bacterium]